MCLIEDAIKAKAERDLEARLRAWHTAAASVFDIHFPEYGTELEIRMALKKIRDQIKVAALPNFEAAAVKEYIDKI